MTTSVLVAYASAYGSTRGVARAIGDRLERAGLHADVVPSHEVRALASYDAVVLGSAIHGNAWLSSAAAFVDSHAAALATRPVWLFSVASIGETSSFLGPRASRVFRRLRRDSRELAALRSRLRPRDHRYFAGAIERVQWNVVGDLFFRLCGGSYGDHRDWRDIAAWADGIARQLRAAEAPSREVVARAGPPGQESRSTSAP